MRHAESALLRVGRNSGRAIRRSGTPFDFSGHWLNELNSYMDLSIQANIVTGTYVSGVSSGGGPTPPFPLTGTISDDLITFVVNWGPMITAWVGHGVYENGAPQILTLWHMVMAIQNETDPNNQWKTVEAGADVFHR